MTNTTVGREPIQIIEIEQPRCANTYSIAPCTANRAAGSECYNTFKSCQDPANYDGSKLLTWRFSKSSANRTLDTYEASSGDFKSNPIPSLLKASTSPTEINTGGTSKMSSAFGIRAALTCTFQDHTDTDSFSDPYVLTRSYNPLNQGSFWGKWKARNPFYNNYVIRVYDGYEGESLASMVSREYIIDKIDGPNSNGVVKITSKDPLRLADSDRALFPEASNIQLKSAITDVQTAGVRVLTVDDSIKNANFSLSRRIIIGSEIIQYAGATQIILNQEYELTGVTRGTDGTTASAFDAGDSVQICGVFDGMDLGNVIFKLLNLAGLNIPIPTLSVWQVEFSTYLTEFNTSTKRIITKPTPINKLIGSLSGQASFNIWWDEREKGVKVRAIRPPDATPELLTDNANIIAGSVVLSEDPLQRVSRTAISYNPFDFTETSEPNEFENTYIFIDVNSESSNQYGEIRNKTILADWLTTESQAARTTVLLNSLYKDITKVITFKVDAKDRDIWTGDVVDIQHRNLQGLDGSNEQSRWQIISAEEVVPGEVVKYKAQVFEFTGRFAFIVADDSPDFTSATTEQLERGGWITDNSGLMSDASEGYKIQ